MARKELVVSFSPGTGPFDTPSWVDISSRTLEAQWTWGRQRDTEGFPPGQATVVLRNHDRLFDPANTSGTYSGDLLPRVPFRLRTDDAEDLFYGFVEDGWEQTYDHPEDGFCTVKLVDLLGVLEGRALPGVYEAAVLALSPVHYWPLTSQGSTDLGSGTRPGTPEENPTFNAPELFPGLGPSVELDGDKQRIDISRSPLDFDWQHATIAAAFQTDIPAEAGSEHPIFFMGDSNDPATDLAMLHVGTDGFIRWSYVQGGTGFSVESDRAVDDGAPHLVIAQSNVGSGSGFGVALDSATLNPDFGSAGGQAGNGVALGGSPFAPRGYSDNYFPGRIGHVAIFDAVLTEPNRQTLVDAVDNLDGTRSDEQVAWVLDQVGVPSGMRNLDQGRSLMGPARTSGVDALEFIRKVADTEQGMFFVDHADGGKVRFVERFAPWVATRSTVSQATFSDDPASGTAVRVEPGSLVVEANGIRTVINQATVRWENGEETAEDATSVAAYGPRGRSVDTLAANANQARSVAQWLSTLYAEPATRVRGLGINPAGAEAGFDAAVALRVGDLVTYRSQPSATGSVTTKNLLIQGVTHTVSMGKHWATSFYTADTPADLMSLFTLGTSELNGPDLLAY